MPTQTPTLEELYTKIENLNPDEVTDFFPEKTKEQTKQTLSKLIETVLSLKPETKSNTETDDLARFTKSKLLKVLNNYSTNIEQIKQEYGEDNPYYLDYLKSYEVINSVYNYAHAISTALNAL